MKRSWMSKMGKSPTSKVKAKIQKLLTQLVRLRDGGCFLRKYPAAGACSGPTAADHLISRMYSATYADSRNVVCACQRHHIYYKPSNPFEYARFVEDFIGKKTYGWMIREAMDKKPCHKTEWDWEKERLALEAEIRGLEKRTETA